MGLKFDLKRGLHIVKAEQRFYDWQNYVPVRSPFPSMAGPVVTTESTLGLATAGAAVRLISQAIGNITLKVYRGEKPDVSEARGSWQWERLKEAPNDEQSAFDFWQDAAASIEIYGNAFIWKAVAGRPIRDAGDIELFLIDPARIQIKRDDSGRKYYEVRSKNGQMERVPASRILHIRGWTSSPGADWGLSPIALHRETLGSALAASQYQSSFFSNGTSVPGFISLPVGALSTQEDIDRLKLEWEQRHSGIINAGRPGILANGADWKPTGISMKDAQYIEIQGFSGEEICRIFGIWPRMLGFQMNSGESTDDDLQRFLQVDLGPRIRRIEMALATDPDLFPRRLLFPEFQTATVLRPTFKARAEAMAKLVEVGILTVNEGRALENLPPKSGGDTIQQTPVGGAPNANEPAVTENGE